MAPELSKDNVRQFSSLKYAVFHQPGNLFRTTNGKVIVSVFFLLLYFGVGTGFYKFEMEISGFHAFYFCVITFGTIGNTPLFSRIC